MTAPLPNTVIAQVCVYERTQGEWFVGLRLGGYMYRHGRSYPTLEDARHNAILMTGVVPVVLLLGEAP